MTLRCHFTGIKKLSACNLKGKDTFHVGLKILGHLHRAVPVRFRPGAPFSSEKRHFYSIFHNVLVCLKSGQKGSIRGQGVDTMKPLSVGVSRAPESILSQIPDISKQHLELTGVG